MLLFEWDPKKAKKNLEIHGISFDEVVVHTERFNSIRVISARKATQKERKQYEENAKRSGHD